MAVTAPVYLVVDVKPTARRWSPICCPVEIDIPCAWWPSTPTTVGCATSAQKSRTRFLLISCAAELDHELSPAVRDFVGGGGCVRAIFSDWKVSVLLRTLASRRP